MARPYSHVTHLILATARKRYPFALLGVRGLVAYFLTREDAESFISMEGAQ